MGNRGKEKKETEIHRKQDGADRSRHDNKQQRSREREMNTDEKQKTGPTYMPGVLGSVMRDIMDGESCTWRIKRSWAIVVAPE